MTETRGAAVAAQPGNKSAARGSGRVRTAVVWDVVRAALTAVAGGRAVDVIDAGGGTGGFAVPLAELGHRVTVVDSSPDALAALERRAAEAGVTVRAVQGDAAELPDLLGSGSADLVLCHNVLEYVDDPERTMAALASTVRPGGSISVLAAGRLAVALHRAIAGHFDDARRVLSDPAGRWGDRDPTPRRFTCASLTDLATAAGLRPGEVHGVRIFADLVPSGLAESDREATDALVALELAAATHPALRDLATQLHLLAHRA
ncbi:SAM-dependent methyltransferase [Actinomadura craniellae]|uniref:SAM-dependent methyltransferase n=1 Tax=Actinomadura craniellae TaxID=2231787 RepID=A0A365HBN0_9ACTN|nr:methyltransferase domain-containing protein [Actinomadura craniellae]RAY16540.1 SAM-dependent methyltransferase [Actinomadura craniellae]